MSFASPQKKKKKSYLLRHWSEHFGNCINISIRRSNIHLQNPRTKIKITLKKTTKTKAQALEKMNLSEIIDIVIWVRGFSDKEIAVKQGNLVELVLVDPIIDDHIGIPTLCRHKSLALYHVDVFVAGSRERGGFGVVLDVEVFLVVNFLELVLVHVVVIGAGSVGVSVVSAGEEWVVASERSGNGAFEKEWWWGVEEEGGVWGGECGEFVWW